MGYSHAHIYIYVFFLKNVIQSWVSNQFYNNTYLFYLSYRNGKVDLLIFLQHLECSLD
jgi:hypothetical protein